VKPTATRAYIMPSMSPLTTNWPNSARSMEARALPLAFGRHAGARLGIQRSSGSFDRARA
jgi:hypothetical protein